MPPIDDTDDSAPIARRRFFRAGLRQLLKPLAQAVDAASQVANQLAKMEDEAGQTAAKHDVPRPVADVPQAEQDVLVVRPPEGETSARSSRRPPPRRVE
jgi:hypothetical protein